MGPDIRNFAILVDTLGGDTCMLVAKFPSDKGYVITQIYNEANNYISLAVGGCAPGQTVTPNVLPYDSAGEHNRYSCSIQVSPFTGFVLSSLAVERALGASS